MNICFFMGNVIEIGKFKFILNKHTKHKSEILLKIQLHDGNIIQVVAYDKMADYILRNNFSNSLVFIRGELKSKSRKEILVNICYIEKVKGVIVKNEKEKNAEKG